MKITIARTSGFCIGVEKAFQRIIEELDKPVRNQIYGELIHNPQVTELLTSRGLHTVHDIHRITADPVIIRTHGVPRNELTDLKKISRSVVNLTCSRVSHVQGIIKKHAGLGYFAVILGDANHAEVKGLVSYASAGHMLISSPEEIPHTLDPSKQYIVVSQTTFDRNLFEQITGRLRELNSGILVFNTICNSTHNRQSEVQDLLSQGVDLLVVIGGRHSSNTKRLADIGRTNNVRTLHIETADEIIPADIKKARHILVTAGASTPSWIVDEVLDVLYAHTGTTRFFRHLFSAAEFLAAGGVIAAAISALPVLFFTGRAIDSLAVFFTLAAYDNARNSRIARKRSLVYSSMIPSQNAWTAPVFRFATAAAALAMAIAAVKAWIAPALILPAGILLLMMVHRSSRLCRHGFCVIPEILLPLFCFTVFFQLSGLSVPQAGIAGILCGLFPVLRQTVEQQIFHSTNRITSAAASWPPLAAVITLSSVCLLALAAGYCIALPGLFKTLVFSLIQIIFACGLILFLRKRMYRPVRLTRTVIEVLFLLASLAVIVF
jgi:(E)-4-hydroxy-3-methyl-but-2-enyl pyrophosphate reductase